MNIQSPPFKLREGTPVSDVVEVVTCAVTWMLSQCPPGELFYIVNKHEAEDGTITLSADSSPGFSPAKMGEGAVNTPMQALGWMAVIIAGSLIALMMAVVCIELFCGPRDKP